MILSSLIGGGAKPYLEYGWVTAPNTAGQSIAANTITTLTIDTEVADTGNYGSIASNQITLAAGTYYFKANAPHGASSAGAPLLAILGLYSVTGSTWVTKRQHSETNYAVPLQVEVDGQFTVGSSTVFELRMAGSKNFTVGMGYSNISDFTLATAGADQRTTIKLWKLA